MPSYSPQCFISFALRLLSPERAAFCEPSLATSWLAEHLRAAGADDDGLCMREDSGDGEAAGALDIHEEGPWAGDESLRPDQLLYAVPFSLNMQHSYLQLVLAGLSLRGRVEEINCENLSGI